MEKSESISNNVYNIKVDHTLQTYKHTHIYITDIRVKIIERKDCDHMGTILCSYMYLNTQDETIETASCKLQAQNRIFY